MGLAQSPRLQLKEALPAPKSEVMTASVEVVDAVQQLLESEGVLQSIRAQLRASVVNALASKTSERRPSKAVSFMSKSSGKCALSLLKLFES